MIDRDRGKEKEKETEIKKGTLYTSGIDATPVKA